MRILHLSDLHLCPSPDAIIYGVNPYDNLMRAIRMIQNLAGIDLCVITGDISNDGSKESYELADKALSDLPFPVYVLKGNHDSSRLFLHHYVKMNYVPRFTFLGFDFIALDTVAVAEDGTNRSRGFISEQEMLRFKDWIREGRSRKIVLMHHPATETGSWLDKRILENRRALMNCISSSDRVIAVLSGHNHQATCERIGNCLFCTAPSVSTSFDKDLKPFEEAHHSGFNVLSINNGICSVKTIEI